MNFPRMAIWPFGPIPMDEPITVEPFPRLTEFLSIEAAVAHALSHPLQFKAQRDGEKLSGARFIDACWTLRTWQLRFDDGYYLVIWSEGPDVVWRVSDLEGEPADGPARHVGAPPVLLRWLGRMGVRPMDCSPLVSKRRGVVFQRLFANDHGLFVYFKGQLVLQFLPVREVPGGQSLLYVSEDD